MNTSIRSTRSNFMNIGNAIFFCQRFQCELKKLRCQQNWVKCWSCTSIHNKKKPKYLKSSFPSLPFLLFNAFPVRLFYSLQNAESKKKPGYGGGWQCTRDPVGCGQHCLMTSAADRLAAHLLLKINNIK